MLSRLIAASFQQYIEALLWGVVLIAFAIGYYTQGVAAGLIFVIGALLFCMLFFGLVFVFLDIRKSVRAIEATLGKE